MAHVELLHLCFSWIQAVAFASITQDDDVMLYPPQVGVNVAETHHEQLLSALIARCTTSSPSTCPGTHRGEHRCSCRSGPHLLLHLRTVLTSIPPGRNMGRQGSCPAGDPGVHPPHLKGSVPQSPQTAATPRTRASRNAMSLSRSVAPGPFFWGFFLQIEESGSPQILILPIAESSVVHKILLRLFQRISIDFLWKV